jgi:hypothetical protein
MRKPSFALAIAVMVSIPGLAQQAISPSSPAQEKASTPARPPDQSSGPVLETKKIPPGSKFYIAQIEGGYDIYLAAAIQQKKVPIVIVTDRSKADYEIAGVSESEKAGWAKMLFLGSQQTSEQASIKIENLKTKNIVYAYNVNKINSARGKQSTSEACAKHLKEKIGLN